MQHRTVASVGPTLKHAFLLGQGSNVKFVYIQYPLMDLMFSRVVPRSKKSTFSSFVFPIFRVQRTVDFDPFCELRAGESDVVPCSVSQDVASTIANDDGVYI